MAGRGLAGMSSRAGTKTSVSCKPLLSASQAAAPASPSIRVHVQNWDGVRHCFCWRPPFIECLLCVWHLFRAVCVLPVFTLATQPARVSVTLIPAFRLRKLRLGRGRWSPRAPSL